METIDRKFIFCAINPCNGHTYDQRNAMVFCAKDKAVPVMLKAYRDECNRIGADIKHLASIDLLIERVEKYQQTIESRVPDTVGTELERCIDGVGVA